RSDCASSVKRIEEFTVGRALPGPFASLSADDPVPLRTAHSALFYTRFHAMPNLAPESRPDACTILSGHRHQLLAQNQNQTPSQSIKSFHYLRFLLITGSRQRDRKSTRLNSSHVSISYAV